MIAILQEMQKCGLFAIAISHYIADKRGILLEILGAANNEQDAFLCRQGIIPGKVTAFQANGSGNAVQLYGVQGSKLLFR